MGAVVAGRRGEREERARRRGDAERGAAAGAGEKRGLGVVGAAGGALTRMRSKTDQGVGIAGGKRADGPPARRRAMTRNVLGGGRCRGLVEALPLAASVGVW